MSLHIIFKHLFGYLQDKFLESLLSNFGWSQGYVHFKPLYLSCQLSSRKIISNYINANSEQECLFVWTLDASGLLFFLFFFI